MKKKPRSDVPRRRGYDLNTPVLIASHLVLTKLTKIQNNANHNELVYQGRKKAKTKSTTRLSRSMSMLANKSLLSLPLPLYLEDFTWYY